MTASARPILTAKPDQSSVYYGWINVALAALAMVGTLPGRTQGLGLITEPLISGLGVDRVTFANINFWATLIGSLFCLPCGRLVDRFGARMTLTAVLGCLAVTVIAMTASHGIAALAVGITFTRGFGQSALSVVSLALVGKWFGKRLNYAMGLYSLLVGIGFIAAFPSVGSAVLSFGWRAAWAGLGWVLLLVFTPIAWILVRDGPARRDLEFSDSPGTDDRTPAGFTLAEALATPCFWVFALSSSVFGLVYSGIALFNQSILEQRGFHATVYHTVLVVSTMLGLLANFGGGLLASRWPIQRLMGLGMALLSLALLALPAVRSFHDVLAYGVAMGVAGGVVTVVFFSVWGQIFGRLHLGKIQGGAQMMTVLASALGPLLLAETLRQTGSYDLIFRVLAGIVILLGVACWTVPIPRRRETSPL